MIGLLVIVSGSAALLGDDPPIGNGKNQVQPATRVIQTARAADFAGLSPSFLRPTAMTFVGPPSELMGPCPHTGISDYLLYLTGEDGIAWFLRDLKTGKLTFLGQEAAPCRGGRGILMALHSMLTVGTDGKGIIWYEVEKGKHGQLIEKGVVPCPPAREMFMGLSQEDLYVRTGDGKLLWFRTGYFRGPPVPTGKDVTGKGLGSDPESGTMCMAPNLRQFYNISVKDHAIACIQRKPNGEIAYQAAIDLEPVARRTANYKSASLLLSPDGYWLYAHLWNGNPEQNCYGLFKRHPLTGELSLQETILGNTDPLANQKEWSVVYSSNGMDGYLSDGSGCVQTFKCHPQTGRLEQRAALKELRVSPTSRLFLDPDTDCLYVFNEGTLSVYQGEKTPRQQVVLKTTPLDEGFFAKREDTVAAWLGMAGLVINARGTVILIDPLITMIERNGKMINEGGFPQKVPLPIQSDKVPRLDALCYTHAHADHFRVPTVKVLEERLQPLFIAPFGLNGTGVDIDEKRIIKPKDWQTYRLGNIELTFTPCRHGNTPATGYLIKTPDGTLWYPGDTNFFDDLLRVPDVDIYFLDVPATGNHLGPEGAARLAQSSRAKLIVANHYGTFLTTAEWIHRNPLHALPFVRDLKGKFITPGPGEVIRLPLKK
jgi:L-ascorbate metabolism protein UlaG (beta-lactamase superfamily)